MDDEKENGTATDKHALAERLAAELRDAGIGAAVRVGRASEVEGDVVLGERLSGSDEEIIIVTSTEPPGGPGPDEPRAIGIHPTHLRSRYGAPGGFASGGALAMAAAAMLGGAGGGPFGGMPMPAKRRGGPMPTAGFSTTRRSYESEKARMEAEAAASEAAMAAAEAKRARKRSALAAQAARGAIKVARPPQGA